MSIVELALLKKSITDMSHDLAEQSAVLVWNNFADKMIKIPELTGCELITGSGTLLADFICYMITMMKIHVDKYAMKYTKEELLQAAIDSACTMMEIKTISIKTVNMKDKKITHEFKIKP